MGVIPGDRAAGVARSLVDGGALKGDRVAQYLYNCPEYLETTYATYQAGLTPVNTNYRYRADELTYLWENADAVAVVFHGSFAAHDRAVPRPGARRCAGGCGSTTAAGRARSGPSPTSRWRVAHRVRTWRRGDAAATTS